MSEKDGLLSKLIRTYNDFKNRKINNLDSRKEKLKLKLKSEQSDFNNLINEKEKLKEEDKNVDLVFNSLVTILKSRGIIFDVPNKNFQVKEWDNLYIKKSDNLYSFANKNGVCLYVLEKKYGDVMEYIVNNYSYSIVVIRKNPHSLKVQLRIVK
ncbi:hypothetical protein [Clostridium sp. OS1-26]|uniref:hypothetical protein n=1 Tax=Clostridium sp. OS1-26 TaxID=3070681 RepID=UPI0027E1520D|nr:hypothetical protein [Clostridium sp. OS1-26]WML37614.1 hypothetical protein RCG18_13935 [Clostridium sp. OS1-26]